MNEYPAVMEEAQEKNEQLSVYRNYNKDIKAVIIKAILTVMFLYFFISLLAGVIVNTPGFGYNLNQIVVKYEYIAEGVPISYVIESVNFVYDLVIDYILLFCCIINTFWCYEYLVIGISALLNNNRVSPFTAWHIRMKRKTTLFFFRWNVVSVILIVILKISKIIIF